MDINEALVVVNEVIDMFIAAPPPGTSLSNYPKIMSAKSAINEFVSEARTKQQPAPAPAAAPAPAPAPAATENGDQPALLNGDRPSPETTGAT